MEEQNGRRIYANLSSHLHNKEKESRSNPNSKHPHNSADVYDDKNNASDEDYDSFSSDDEHARNVSHKSKVGVNNGQMSDTLLNTEKNEKYGLGATQDKPAHIYVNQLSLLPPEHSRPRSLSRVSEGSHASADFETKDDLYIRSPNTGKAELSRVSSASTLTGSTRHLDIFYDAQISRDLDGSDISPESDGVIVSGNVGSGHSSNNIDVLKISTSPPNSQRETLNKSDVAYESTPKPSDDSVFQFPSTSPTFHKTDISAERAESSSSNQPPRTDGNGSKFKPATPSTVLAEVSVHKSSASDIPLSLRNLVFLTQGESPLPSINDSSLLTAGTPGYLLT